MSHLVLEGLQGVIQITFQIPESQCTCLNLYQTLSSSDYILCNRQILILWTIQEALHFLLLHIS